MKRVIGLLLALTVALSLAACGGSASSSAASSEAASESASEAASSEPEAAETPAPAVSNYFAEHGVEVLPSLPEKSPKVYYCTWQKDNPDVYAQWDDADISFSQTVEPSDEKEGYKKVTLETVVLLSKGEIDSKKVRVEFSLEDMDTSGFQQGATYGQIKEWVLEQTGLKVSSLYISQIKRKCGLEVGQSYNLSKKENAKQPQCPPEKEAAIMEALKYFHMV